jgi:hypothetical protein
MHVRVSGSIPALVAIAPLVLAACDTNGIDGSTVTLTAPGSLTSMALAIEPATIRPEFLSSSSCRTRPSFRGRLSVTVRAGADRFLRHIRFEFRDRFGSRALPTAVPIPSISTSIIPTSTTVPMPTSSPIPIPGHVPFGGTLISSGISLTQAFSLHFACGHGAVGTLFVEIESADRQGTIDVSRTSVPVE